MFLLPAWMLTESAHTCKAALERQLNKLGRQVTDSIDNINPSKSPESKALARLFDAGGIPPEALSCYIAGGAREGRSDTCISSEPQFHLHL